MVVYENKDAFEKLQKANSCFNTIVGYKITEIKKTHVMAEYNLKNGEIIPVKLTVITIAQIRDLLLKKQNINIDLCYLKDFDITTLKDTNEVYYIPEKFSAKYALFEGETNFTGFEFNKVSFKGAVFSRGQTIFNNCQFGDFGADFNSTTFIASKVYFCFASFNNQKIDFQQSIFNDGVEFEC